MGGSSANGGETGDAGIRAIKIMIKGRHALCAFKIDH
jgi:hypothetical protein